MNMALCESSICCTSPPRKWLVHESQEIWYWGKPVLNDISSNLMAPRPIFSGQNIMGEQVRTMAVDALEPLLLTWFNFNPSMDLYEVWDEIAYPFPMRALLNKWTNNFISYFTKQVVIHPCWDLSQSILVKGPLSSFSRSSAAIVTTHLQLW